MSNSDLYIHVNTCASAHHEHVHMQDTLRKTHERKNTITSL